jgi:serine-protein kinase ATM
MCACVQVLVHNPLYHWALSADKASKRQSKQQAVEDDDGPAASGEVVGNADAGRAVARVSAKLRGLDWGEQEPLSVQGQVEQLLLEATDPQLLCQHFVGWAPWL